MLPSLVLALLAIPVIAVASLVLTLRMRARLTRAEQRLDTLQRWLADRADLEPSAEAPPAALPAPADISAEEKTGTDEPVRPVAEPVPHPPAPTPPPVKAKASLEERFGTQWAVWAGGIALALGGFFLVRYSIEQGWFGPAQRVLLAGLVALALIGAGEWTRRREIKTGIVGLAKAHIPSVLTAAGTAIAYADVYAAYALYGFIGPAVAFVLLGIVALLTLTAALLHGPALAGLGLIGAFATPLIVATEAPNYWALYPRLRHCRRLRPCPGQAMALACHCGDRGKRGLDAACDRRVGRAHAASVLSRRLLHPRRSLHRFGPAVRAQRRAR